MCASACGTDGGVENGSANQTDQQATQNADTSDQADNTEVVAAISATTWLYNGGSETTLNYIKFEDDNKIISGERRYTKTHAYDSLLEYFD